jgi:uncharacterized membrane protein YjjB (DUF3815 family)
MAYGGLRGAVGFSLVEMISQDVVPPKQMFVTTMLATVVFTVFFQVKCSSVNCRFFYSGIGRNSQMEF